MKATKALTTAGVGAAIVTGSMLAVTVASAQDTQTREDRRTEVVERLATELGIEQDQVQGVFDEIKEERQAEREAKRAAHFESLVEAGTLTQEQADQLMELKDGFRAEFQALKESDATREELKEAKEATKAEVQAWAEEQGINLDDIRPDKGEFRDKKRGF